MQVKVKKFLKLEYYRKKYGLTQADMAQLMGITQSNYSHKENKFVPITFDEMCSILKILSKKAIKAGDTELTLDEIFLD